MRYFITGATGFIGGRVAQQLVESGDEVVALARSPQRAKGLADLGVSIAEGDITDKESMRAPMTGVNGVFHIAAWYKVGVRDKRMAERINVDGTRNVLELMEELGVEKGVYTSTLAVFSDTQGKIVDESYRYDGPHLSEYDRTKWVAHYEVAEPMMRQGLPLIIVQPGMVYGLGDTGPLSGPLQQYLRGRLRFLPQKTAFCWAHVDDVARGHILAMERGTPGESYIIAGLCHSLVELFEIAERITGVKAPRVRISPAMMRFIATLMGVIETFVSLPETYTAESLRVSAGVTYLGSNEKAKRELGYKVRPLEDGLSQTLIPMMEDL